MIIEKGHRLLLPPEKMCPGKRTDSGALFMRVKTVTIFRRYSYEKTGNCYISDDSSLDDGRYIKGCFDGIVIIPEPATLLLFGLAPLEVVRIR